MSREGEGLWRRRRSGEQQEGRRMVPMKGGQNTVCVKNTVMP